MHSFSTEETRSFTEHVNDVLGPDPELQGRLPINPNSMDLFLAVRDGVLLCKLVNQIKPVIDPSKICLRPTNTFQVGQNHTLAIEGARSLGMKMINIGPGDLKEGKPHLVLGFMWQAIRMAMLNAVSVDKHPELLNLMAEGENVDEFVNLPPEKTLLRWFNYHLRNARHPRTVTNFDRDIQDCTAYYVLLNQLDPRKCTLNGIDDPDPMRRAENMLRNADTLGCRKFVTPTDVVQGNPKLNLLFTAKLFNDYVCLEENKARNIQEMEARKREAEDAWRRKQAHEQQLIEQQRAAEEEAWRKKLADYEASAMRELEDKRRQLQNEEEERRRKMAEEELRRKHQLEEEERARRARWEEEDRRREAERRKREEDEAARRRWEEEQRRIEEERRRQEEERRRLEEERRQQQERLERERQAALQAQYAAEERAKQAWMEQQEKQRQWEEQQRQRQQWEEQQRLQQQQQWQEQQRLAQQQAWQTQQTQWQPAPSTQVYTTTTTTTQTHTQLIAKLYITVAEARGLRKSDLMGLAAPDPYCILQLRNQRLQTRKEKTTVHPVWHQEFEFGRFGPKDTLTISVFDRDRFSKDDFLGQVVLRRKDLVDGLRKWFPLQSRPGIGDKVKGEIFLHVRYGV